jgi:hypothetical protein
VHASPGRIEPEDTAEPEDAPEVVTLRRWRIRFVSVAGVGLACFLGYAILSSFISPPGSGGAAELSGIVIVALLVAGVAGLLGLGVTTLMLRLRGAGSVLPDDGRLPDRVDDRIFRVFYVAMALVGLLFIPAQVDSVAYLADASPQATFIGKSYEQQCTRYCTTYTRGIIEPAGIQATKKGQIPLGKPTQVAVPLWAFGVGYDRVENASDAITATLGTLAFECVAGYGIILLILRRQRRRAG